MRLVISNENGGSRINDKYCLEPKEYLFHSKANLFLFTSFMEQLWNVQLQLGIFSCQVKRSYKFNPHESTLQKNPDWTNTWKTNLFFYFIPNPDHHIWHLTRTQLRLILLSVCTNKLFIECKLLVNFNIRDVFEWQRMKIEMKEQRITITFIEIVCQFRYTLLHVGGGHRIYFDMRFLK